MKIIPLSEGNFTVDQTKKFIAYDPDKNNLQERTKGSLLVEIQPFLVITSKDILLLDTGLGFADKNGQMQIHKNLISHGIKPTDVTKVLLSHLHKDHAGGIALPGKSALSFKNAMYYINRKDWTYAFEKGFPSFHTDDFLLLEGTDQLVFTDDVGTINDYIFYEVTGGHSPFHQVFLVEDEGEKVFFGGDVAPQLLQMKNRIRAKYDYDGERSIELRNKWWKTGEQDNWTFLFYHDIKTPIFKFRPAI